MIVLTPEEMKSLDRKTEEIFGLDGKTLMENAGRGIVEVVCKFLTDTDRSIIFLSGRGNNAGDGFCAARYLHLMGYSVKVWILGLKNELSEPALHQLTLLERTGCEVQRIEKDLSLFTYDTLSADMVVDAVFGTGFRGELDAPQEEIFKIFNQSKGLKLAVDVPSGVNGETGEASEGAISADVTVTFAFPKTGHFLYPGKKNRGKLYLIDIGIPYYYAEEEGFKRNILTADSVANCIPKREPWAHKGMCGRVFVLSGSRGYTGAAGMVAHGALKAGAGLVYLGIPGDLNPILETKLTEEITIPLPSERGHLTKKSLPRILEWLEKVDVVIAGPGLGRTETIQFILLEILSKYNGKIVLDADAIPLLERKSIEGRKAEIVFTPHPGELGAFLGKSPHEIDQNRMKIVEEISKEIKGVLTLKGAPTIIATPEETWINTTGNPGLASGGTGDVLAGLIGGFWAQGLSGIDSAKLGVFIHGLSADLAIEKTDVLSLSAMDLFNYIPAALRKIYCARDKGHGLVKFLDV